ncbi:unnamed protein product [Fusarium graminearum]|uniref:Uncharacterized protein n=1 Tax=Gibberella zeae TaxID=5518 RepID=A0A4E9DGH5_GIBZA|nr:unnamed protein product [Fusarium graminearum]CAF3647746.1 unnamed protein product [Fusarium graminearum]CAG1960577.1 unnamed protein product [Fusarium graminearum]CAG1973913.1 unnamed protein product [Fusarium graminearum]
MARVSSSHTLYLLPYLSSDTSAGYHYNHQPILSIPALLVTLGSACLSILYSSILLLYPHLCINPKCTAIAFFFIVSLSLSTTYAHQTLFQV